MPRVNPTILKWARESAGLSVEEATKTLSLRDTREFTGQERLKFYESGDLEPTTTLLKAMSQKYRRSLLVFYLDEPPRKADRGTDFRTVAGASRPEIDPTLDTLIRDIRARQAVVRAIIEEQEGRPLDFVGSVKAADDEESLRALIVKQLNFNLSVFRGQRTTNQAFSYLRSLIEGVGVFVLLAGNLGSYHTNIPASVFRGYALADSLAPFIVINDQDAHSAWAFTALHELAHLWLGATGISGWPAPMPIERFCNNVAGSILLPAEDIASLRVRADDSAQVLFELVSEAARERHLSRSMVAYRLYLLGMIDHRLWVDVTSKIDEERASSALDKKDGSKGQDGPSYYVIKRHRVGDGLMSLVRASLRDGLITYTKASKALGVKPRNVEPLLYPTLNVGA